MDNITSRSIRLWALLVLCGGCGDRLPTAAEAPGSWQVLTVDPPRSQVRQADPGRAIPSITVALDGPAGFLRATVVVERTRPDLPPTTALYDVLFPTSGPARLEASLQAAADRTGATRVLVRVESAAARSEGFVEPVIPALAGGAEVALEGSIDLNRSITGGEEVEVGRWVVRDGPATTKVIVRVLPSQRPTGPRLKPESRPPS